VPQHGAGVLHPWELDWIKRVSLQNPCNLCFIFPHCVIIWQGSFQTTVTRWLGPISACLTVIFSRQESEVCLWTVLLKLEVFVLKQKVLQAQSIRWTSNSAQTQKAWSLVGFNHIPAKVYNASASLKYLKLVTFSIAKKNQQMQIFQHLGESPSLVQ